MKRCKCGSTPEIRQQARQHSVVWFMSSIVSDPIVFCSYCGRKGPIGKNEKDAVEKWNAN